MHLQVSDMPAKLRVANWNVNRPVSPIRVVNVNAAINAIAADIIVLSETHDALDPGYAYQASSMEGRDGRHGKQHRWVGIHSNFRLEPQKTADACRTAAARIFHPSGPILVYGLVLPWKGSTWRDSATADAFAAALDLQIRDFSRLRSLYPNDTFVALGDFNQDLVGARYAGSAKNGELLSKQLREACLITVTAGENDPVRSHSPRYACIDHICIANEGKWKVDGVGVWPNAPSPVVGLSDHFGVYVDLINATASA